ncbi:hypothetical protein MANES_12G090016v8 [Manihot esculenta]|uniref:Uncharacterized protein n=1 Tax=Manihot esculenta TaxID=3983 RepID=A0ACB7GQ54_MANES|nr:hypothetical protein MANES_12G090016v8 [Manihot esculenta]
MSPVMARSRTALHVRTRNCGKQQRSAAHLWWLIGLMERVKFVFLDLRVWAVVA